LKWNCGVHHQSSHSPRVVKSTFTTHRSDASTPTATRDALKTSQQPKNNRHRPSEHRKPRPSITFTGARPHIHLFRGEEATAPRCSKLAGVIMMRSFHQVARARAVLSRGHDLNSRERSQRTCDLIRLRLRCSHQMDRRNKDAHGSRFWTGSDTRITTRFDPNYSAISNKSSK